MVSRSLPELSRLVTLNRNIPKGSVLSRPHWAQLEAPKAGFWHMTTYTMLTAVFPDVVLGLSKHPKTSLFISYYNNMKFQAWSISSILCKAMSYTRYRINWGGGASKSANLNSSIFFGGGTLFFSHILIAGYPSFATIPHKVGIVKENKGYWWSSWWKGPENTISN